MFEVVILTNKENAIYHYTDINALKNIIENKTLWLTRSDFLNDSSEIVYLKKLIKDEIKNDKYDWETEDIYLEISDYIDFGIPRLYILSMSNNNDSLTLWSNYTNNYGYNIEFNRELIINEICKSEIFLKIKSGHYNSALLKNNVIYGINEQTDKIREYLNEYYVCFKNKEIANDIMSQKQLELKQNMVVACLFAKGLCYCQEEEYRLARLMLNTEQYEEYKISNGAISPYIELKFTNCLPINKITIAPKNNVDLAKKGLELFLKKNGYENVEVVKSKISLRF